MTANFINNHASDIEAFGGLSNTSAKFNDNYAKMYALLKITKGNDMTWLTENMNNLGVERNLTRNMYNVGLPMLQMDSSESPLLKQL